MFMSMGPEKAYLALIKPKAAGGPAGGGEIGRVTFMYNPREFNYKKSASWDSKPAKGAKSAAPPEFKGAEPMTLSVEVFLDAFETGTDISPQIDLLTSCCVPLPDTISSNKPSPPWVLFGWGSRVHLTAFVKSVDVKVSMFTADGTPVRAACTVSLQEIPDEVAKQNPTSGSRNALRSRTVVAGDTLASIAFEEYQQTAAWRVLADANGVDDPLRLRAGTRLLVPDLDSTSRAAAASRN